MTATTLTESNETNHLCHKHCSNALKMFKIHQYKINLNFAMKTLNMEVEQIALTGLCAWSKQNNKRKLKSMSFQLKTNSATQEEKKKNLPGNNVNDSGVKAVKN